MASRRPSRRRISVKHPARVLDARPDTLDFRDQMFEPTLIEVPVRRPLASYRRYRVPILDQGREGACTGFGLATVIHYLLRTRAVVPDRRAVSARMLYDMARRYDEWPGDSYEGSSARGAMKGWHKHGVCSSTHWAFTGKQNPALFADRFKDALRRPLGAYLRVNHRDIVAMHAAIAEVGVLYATARVHEGWQAVGTDGTIAWKEDAAILGGHAFAIVAYDERGFWIQNSWAASWGFHGFGRVSYDDWLANGSDVWVARLGAPIALRARESVAVGISKTSQGTRSYMFCDLRPHIISLGNDGRLRTDGTYGTSEADVVEIFRHIGSTPAGKRRLLLYAHGGLVSEDAAIQKVADLRSTLLDEGVYPVSLIWKTDFWTTLGNILQDALSRRRPEGLLDSAKDFMLDRLDDALEPLARIAGGKLQWDEMKENAMAAAGAGLAVVLAQIRTLKARNPDLEIHLVGHSAGSILLGGLIASMREGPKRPLVPVTSCTLWAPACTMDLYRAEYLPSIRSGALERFALFTLTDQAERADSCAHIYHKSLLYLVSNAFEAKWRKPLFGSADGEPLLGMEKFVSRLDAAEQPDDWVLSPNAEPSGSRDAAKATAHGGFDDDPATLKATLTRVLNRIETAAVFRAHRTEAFNRAQRAALGGLEVRG
jgi:papain like protease